MGEMRNSYKILIGQTEVERPLRRSKRRWEDNIIVELRELVWINLAQDRDQWRALLITTMNRRVP
jgi:hypothetical protein